MSNLHEIVIALNFISLFNGKSVLSSDPMVPTLILAQSLPNSLVFPICFNISFQTFTYLFKTSLLVAKFKYLRPSYSSIYPITSGIIKCKGHARSTPDLFMI